MAEKKQQKIHTYKEYREKYGKKFDDGKLEFVSFTDSRKLNKKKKYWKIEDKKPGYYEVSKKPWVIPVIVIGSVAAITAAVVPAVLLTRPQPTPPGPVIKTVNLTVTGDGCKVVVGGEKKDTYTFTYDEGSKPTESIYLKANNTYIFPVSQIDLPSFLEYKKVDDTNATLSFVDNINNSADVTIKATQQTGDCSFDFNGTNCTLNNLPSYDSGESVNLTLAPTSAAYDVPEHIAVKINDVIQTEGEDYIYTPNDTSATLSLTVTGDVKVEALAREKDLALTLKIKPTAIENMLGFAFQCTPKGGGDPDPTVDKIIVDWGDETPVDTINAPSCIDDDIIQSGGMYEYIGSGMQGPFPTTSDFQRHTYNDLSVMPEDGFTVKFYGDINNIAFGFPHPSPAYKTTVVPWGTANKHITSITTYCDLPAEHINSAAGSSQGIDFDTYVIFSNEEEINSVNFALGTTTIPNGCCSKAGGLTTVDIPETVTKIGDQAFWISGLQEATIPDSVTLIGEQAFCEAQLGNGVHFGPNSQLEEIAKSAFQACAYEEFSLPDSVTTVGEMAFRESDTLKTFTISPNSQLEIINSQTFSDDNALEKIYIPKSVTSIVNNAFDECDLLSEVDLSDAEFTSIGDYAFKNCPKLKSFNLPTTVTKIGFQAFYNCTSISEIVITNAVETISGEAFYFWTNTQSIYFPDCADLDAIIARYGETAEWTNEATIKPNERP